MDVKFEEMLAQKMDEDGGKVNMNTVKPEIHQPRNTPVKAKGNDVSLETEVGNIIPQKDR